MQAFPLIVSLNIPNMKTTPLPSNQKIEIAKFSPQDERDWRSLYADYSTEDTRLAALRPWDDDKASTVWAWLLDAEHSMKGFIARVNTGQAVGFILFQAIPRANVACDQGYIEDLYVAPSYRGRRIAQALISAVVDVARQKRWVRLRWHTGEDNRKARTLYNRIAQKVNHITYELKVTSDDVSNEVDEFNRKSSDRR